MLYLTKLRCTPNPRCFPLHSKHMKMPYETDAHCGFLVLQSTQVCIQVSEVSTASPHQYKTKYRLQCTSSNPYVLCSPVDFEVCATLSGSQRTPYLSRVQKRSQRAFRSANHWRVEPDNPMFSVAWCRHVPMRGRVKLTCQTYRQVQARSCTSLTGALTQSTIQCEGEGASQLFAFSVPARTGTPERELLSSEL